MQIISELIEANSCQSHQKGKIEIKIKMVSESRNKFLPQSEKYKKVKSSFSSFNWHWILTRTILKIISWFQSQKRDHRYPWVPVSISLCTKSKFKCGTDKLGRGSWMESFKECIHTLWTTDIQKTWHEALYIRNVSYTSSSLKTKRIKTLFVRGEPWKSEYQIRTLSIFVCTIDGCTVSYVPING